MPLRSRLTSAALPLAALVGAGVVSTVVCGPARAAGTNATVLLSRPSGLGALPAAGDNSAFGGRPGGVSGNGRFVVFLSGADDLGVRDSLQHAWVRDTLAGTTTLVDRVPGGGAPGNGTASSLGISRNGRTVCFSSDATNLVAGVTGFHVFVVTLPTGAIVVADRADGSGAVGNEPAGQCALDATGTRVVFATGADNLVSGDNNDTNDVFVRDLALGSTTRVSVDALGAEASNGGLFPAISADGLKIAFMAQGALVANDTNDTTDVYVRDMQAGTLVRASVGTGGVEGDGPSSFPAIDDSGGRIAFVSAATNLDVSGDTNGLPDVFWRDLGSDTTILVSRASGVAGALGDGVSTFPAISGDGVGVAFESLATNLGAGAPPPNGNGTWVYLRRLDTNETSLLSRASGEAGAPADSFATMASLGTAPTVATWTSDAANLDPDASGEFTQVFKRDLTATPATTLVSRPSGTTPRGAAVNESGPSGARAISGDGRLVVFESSSDDLDPAAAGRFSQVFVRDTVTNTTTLVSRGPGPTGAPANGDCREGAINTAGTHVAFIGDAGNLIEGETAKIRQVYVRDLATGALEVASRADAPNAVLPSDVRGSAPDISADGRRVVFVAGDQLVAADTNDVNDVYLRDLVAGTTTLVSVGAGSAAGDQSSTSPSMSDDGMRVAFVSRATNLLGSGPTSGEHVFVRDLLAGTTVLADRSTQDGAPGTGGVRDPEISGAGNRVAFFADDPLTSDVISETGAVYVRDLATDTTLLVSRADGPEGVATSAAPNKVTPPSPSHDGTRVGWAGSGVELPGGTDTLQVYVRDLVANTTRLVSAVDGTAATPGNGEAFGPALSADGGCVAFRSNADDLTTPSYPTQDFGQVYLRDVEGGCPGFTTTSTTLPPGSGTPIATNTLVVRPGKLAKLIAKGLPTGSLAAADPTGAGATLQMSGTTGSASYSLPASGWRPVGRRQPKGFKFKGDACRVSLVRRRLAAVCRGDSGTLRLPEPGPLEVVLVVGTEAYCAECGGRTAGRPARVFKRKGCPAPATCP